VQGGRFGPAPWSQGWRRRGRTGNEKHGKHYAMQGNPLLRSVTPSLLDKISRVSSKCPRCPSVHSHCLVSPPHAPPSSESVKFHNTECCRRDSTPRSSPNTYCPRLGQAPVKRVCLCARAQTHSKRTHDTYASLRGGRGGDRSLATRRAHRCLATRRAACLARRSLRFDSGARST
jgi:hypothetical protein